jgi:hypothetical protein
MTQLGAGIVLTTSLHLLQHTDDLLLGEPALLHLEAPFRFRSFSIIPGRVQREQVKRASNRHFSDSVPSLRRSLISLNPSFIN